MLNFIIGFAVGGVVAIFVYRNNKKKISKYADKIDELWDKIPDHEKRDSSKEV